MCVCIVLLILSHLKIKVIADILTKTTTIPQLVISVLVRIVNQMFQVLSKFIKTGPLAEYTRQVKYRPHEKIV